MPVLYDCSTAPSPRRARILLAEKGVAHETVQVDLRNREQLGDAFRAINPRCTVPVLRTEEGALLTDNAGIAAYAEARWPEPPLLGTTPVEKAEVASWNARIEVEGFMAVAEALRNSAPAMADRALTGPVNFAQIPALAERGVLRAQQFMDMLDAHLAGRDFVVGSALSLADISAAVVVDFARVIKVKPGEHHANLVRWRAGLAQRPAFSL